MANVLSAKEIKGGRNGRHQTADLRTPNTERWDKSMWDAFMSLRGAQCFVDDDTFVVANTGICSLMMSNEIMYSFRGSKKSKVENIISKSKVTDHY